MEHVCEIWRYPVKAVGRERVHFADLIAGQTLPGDRIWAVAHEASKAEDGVWSRCGDFIRAASSPQLMAIEVTTDKNVLEFTHPTLETLRIDPENEGERLIKWLEPLVAKGRPAAARLVRAPKERGMTDTSAPSISLANLASHWDLESRMDRALSIHRWRSNIWVDGLDAWEEVNWVGKRLRIGEAEFEAYKALERCRATEANPVTGERDADMLGALKALGHQNFSIALRVVKGGRFVPNDPIEVL